MCKPRVKVFHVQHNCICCNSSKRLFWKTLLFSVESFLPFNHSVYSFSMFLVLCTVQIGSWQWIDMSPSWVICSGASSIGYDDLTVDAPELERLPQPSAQPLTITLIFPCEGTLISFKFLSCWYMYLPNVLVWWWSSGPSHDARVNIVSSELHCSTIFIRIAVSPWKKRDQSIHGKASVYI